LQAEFTFTELLEGKFDKFYTPDPANKKVWIYAKNESN
jgi:hypothetical protein